MNIFVISYCTIVLVGSIVTSIKQNRRYKATGFKTDREEKLYSLGAQEMLNEIERNSGIDFDYTTRKIIYKRKLRQNIDVIDEENVYKWVPAPDCMQYMYCTFFETKAVFTINDGVEGYMIPIEYARDYVPDKPQIENNIIHVNPIENDNNLSIR